MFLPPERFRPMMLQWKWPQTWGLVKTASSDSMQWPSLSSIVTESLIYATVDLQSVYNRRTSWIDNKMCLFVIPTSFFGAEDLACNEGNWLCSQTETNIFVVIYLFVPVFHWQTVLLVKFVVTRIWKPCSASNQRIESWTPDGKKKFSFISLNLSSCHGICNPCSS